MPPKLHETVIPVAITLDRHNFEVEMDALGIVVIVFIIVVVGAIIFSKGNGSGFE